MHRTVTALAATAILACWAVPAPAQQTTGTPQTTATAQPPATSPNRTATTATIPQTNAATYAQLIAAVNNTRTESSRLAAMQNLTTNNVRIVKVQTIVGPEGATALNAALARDQAQVAALRQTLSNTRLTATTDNSTITIGQFLADNKIDTSRVVAVDVTGGSVIVFVQ